MPNQEIQVSIIAELKTVVDPDLHKDIVSLGICDQILPEPLGGAHNDWSQVSSTIKDALIKEVKSLLKDSEEILIELEK